METLFLTILNMSVTATYVIAVVLLLRLLLKRAPKKYSYLLWTVVLFRLVCPVSVTSSLSLFNAPPFDMSTAQKSGEAALSYVPADIGYAVQPEMTVGIQAVNAIISDRLPAPALEASVNPMQVWLVIGSTVWAFGAAALLIYGIFSYIRLKRKMATAVRLDDRIFESDVIQSPFILGFVKPRIYIPFGLGEVERQYILQHEACHLRRKDHLIKPLAFIVLAFHWYNPFVWLAFNLMAKDMEMSCDEHVLSKIGSGITKEYCTSLLAFASNRRFPSTLAFGETGIRERIQNVLRFKPPTKRAVVVSITACVLAVAVCATNPTVSGALGERAGWINFVNDDKSGETSNTNNEVEPFGHYKFEKQLYMNPLSSSFSFEGYEEYYTFTKTEFILTDGQGNQTNIPITYKRTTADTRQFADDFWITIGDVPNLAAFQKKDQYMLNGPEESQSYRLYVLDDEVWLAKMQRNNRSQASEKEYFWSIFQLTKLDEEPTGKVAIAGNQEGVAAFTAMHQTFNSGYDNDASHNITPRAIKENSDYQIFKYDTSAAAFLVHDGEVYQLGESLGGNGLTSMALADMDRDGQKELYFTHSFGSGLHRSHVAYYNPADKQIHSFNYAHMNGELAFVQQKDGGLALYSAVLSNMEDFAHFDIEPTDFITHIVYENGQILLDSQDNGAAM